ncbi:uncharacterized protein [Misgurnus anguillicaudatus]|uniref:uncharacterized protein n=1 Tax=Misgurnus anguillicaudatus TaxID=75329 RepID=UPI003CCF7C32
MLNASRHLFGLVKALQKSLQRRFQGMFANVRMDETAQLPVELPFGDMIYLLSAVLDPSFCLFWLDHDVLAPDEVKSEVKEIMIDLLLVEAQKVTIPEGSSEEDEEEPLVPAKTPWLFSGYRKKGTKKKADHHTSCKDGVICYIHVCSEEEVDCMDFWEKHAKIFPRLYIVSMKLLAVPATSAPVERVFSHGGLIMRPHRARLGAKTLSSLIFLKCNHSVA